MNTLNGQLSKMKVELNESGEVQYWMRLSEGYQHHRIDLNQLIGREIEINWSGDIACVACGVPTKKSYAQGHCGDCLKTLASCDMCIVKPETCHFDQGTCRGENWAKTHCMRPHYVYLANSSGAKVGITRSGQVPTRWIDQGAVAATLLYEVPDRKTAGLVEVELAKELGDKTNWRKMLKNEVEEIDLLALKQRVLKDFSFEGIEAQESSELCEIKYPVELYPSKIKSLSLDKTPQIRGKLNGIKGQYLLLDCGELNIRKHSGYIVTCHY